MDKTALYVVDWQIRNILRLKSELKNAGSKKTKKIHRHINNLCQNMNILDPDKTKRLELLFLYFREYLRTAGAKKRMNLLTHSLSEFLFSCGPQSKLDDYLLRQLLEHKTIAQVMMNTPQKTSSLTQKAIFATGKKQITHD